MYFRKATFKLRLRTGSPVGTLWESNPLSLPSESVKRRQRCVTAIEPAHAQDRYCNFSRTADRFKFFQKVAELLAERSSSCAGRHNDRSLGSSS